MSFWKNDPGPVAYYHFHICHILILLITNIFLWHIVYLDIYKFYSTDVFNKIVSSLIIKIKKRRRWYLDVFICSSFDNALLGFELID